MAVGKEAMLRAVVETGVYLVTEDRVPSEERIGLIAQALEAGARVVQLRDKHSPRGALLKEAIAIRDLCHHHGAVFIVNDDLALAWCCDADGVHVGQDDLPASEARRLMGDDKLVGLSVSTLDEALEADRLGVDYIGVGAIFATPTKTDAELGGLELLQNVRGRVSRPLIAIGGIDATNAATVFQAGADSVAVVRAVFAAQDVAAATRNLLEIARRARGERMRS